MSTSTPRMVVVPIDRLRPGEGNAKEHTEEQIEQLRASIRRFGFNDPIGVDGDYRIVEGHGRYEAAVREGLAEVPVILLDHLTEREKRAYAVAHNQTQLSSGLDLSQLEAEIGRVQVREDEFFSLGFSEDDVYFLSLHETEPEETRNTEQRADNDGWGDLIEPVVRSVLKFSTWEERARFVDLANLLASRYPEETSLASRLHRFVREFPVQ